MQNETRMKRLFRVNMLIGVLVTAAAVFMMLTGHYENLQQRLAADKILNFMVVGGLLYSVGFWYMCVFRKQLFEKYFK